MKKCNRIYHEFLKNIDNELYRHLMHNQVSPELSLMRWLRCCLSREFKIDQTLMLWDYIFSGIEASHKANPKAKGLEYLPLKDDPLINLDYLCVSMIINIKKELMQESDMSMCLSHLLNYPE